MGIAHPLRHLAEALIAGILRAGQDLGADHSRIVPFEIHTRETI